MCCREIPGPRLDAAGDPGDAPLLRAGRARADPRLRRRGAEAADRPRGRAVAGVRARPSQSSPMTITFAEKLARMPGYQAGVPTGQAPEAIAAGQHRPARLQRVALPAAPEGGRGDPATAGGDEPLPGPRRDAAAPPPRRALRDRAGPDRRRQRLLRDPARRRRGALRARRRDRLRLAVLLDVPVPAGADRRPRDPRAARRGRRPRPRRDGGRGDRGDPAADRLQPEQPDRDPHPGGRDRRLLRADPAARDGDPRRGLRRVPDPRRPRRDASTCSPTSRTWSSCAPSASATASPGCGSATRSARPSSAPRSTPCASRSASTPSPRRPGRRRSSTRTTSCAGSRARSPSGSRVEEGLRELGLRTTETHANFSWIDLGDADEAAVDRRPRRARDRGPPRQRRSAAPATSASATAPPAENDRFLAWPVGIT